MLTAYRPGQGRLHRMSAGVKTVLLLLLAIGILLLPSQWWSAGVAVGVTVAGYALAQLRDGLCGMRELGRQVRAMWWIIAFTLVSQLIFTGVEPAVANTARVTASLALAGLLRRHRAIRQHDARATATGEAGQHVLQPGVVGIALGRNAMHPARVVLQLLGLPI